jgi:2-polyprenyl-6-hydroxyphenyl methylase/3-demethylubiquinone-9 3-methyltransferase
MDMLMNPASNVDPAEIAKFNEIASRWWDPTGEFKPLHQLNPCRLAFISDQVQGLFGKKAVDVGCGGGILAEAMAKAGAEVTGIDMADEALTVAKLHALESKVSVQYQQSTAEDFAAANQGSFDLVTCMEMLEHVPDPASVVQACAQLVKPGGCVFFSTINRNLKSYGLAIVAAEYVLNMLPKGTHEFEKFLKPSEMAGFCRQAGLAVTHSRGLQHNPLTGRYWLNEDCSVNYMLATRRSHV